MPNASEQRLRAYLRPGAPRCSWWWVYLRNPFNGDLISQRLSSYKETVRRANELLANYIYYPHVWIVEKPRLL